jgi:hypothetical protein
MNGTRTTVVRPGSGFADAARFARLLGLRNRKTPEIMAKAMSPKLHRMFLKVNKDYQQMLLQSSLRLGAYSMSGDNGVYFTGQAYNALKESPITIKSDGSLEWSIGFQNPKNDPTKFERMDRGYKFRGKANLQALFNWAKKKYGWNVPTPKDSATFFQRLRRYKVMASNGRTNISWVFWRLYKKVRNRSYKGLRLRKHLTDWARDAFDREAKNLLSESVLRSALVQDNG